MRKSILFKTLLMYALIISFNACRKEASPDKLTLHSAQAEITAKVNAWLDNQKSSINQEINTRIKSLKENLDITRARFEMLSDKEQFLIVPVTDNFKPINNRGNNPVNNLLLIVNESGEIRKGNIVQYVPDNSQIGHEVPQNTFFKMFNEKSIDCNGAFRFLSIMDTYLYELKYENGALHSYGLMQPKMKTVTTNSTNSDCVDWYIVTTYFYEDGTSDRDWEYIGTTCDGCPPNDPRVAQSFLCGDGAGGGGGDIEYEEEYIVTVTCQKPVYFIDTENGGGSCNVTQSLYGKFYKVHTENNKITSCSF